tara:strand:- start:2039 stop:2641 length:603 start_codon:yes stop_codon:yes gene_type:complete
MRIPKSINSPKRAKTFALQVGLKALGYPVGALDGIEGKNTRGAMASFVSAVTERPKAGTTGIPEYATLAYSYIGQKEVPGSGSNPLILGWIKDFLGWGSDDSKVAWCAIFINTMLESSGIAGTGKANARSFLDWGRSVSSPRKGDIVIFERGGASSWKGHVGIYWGESSSSSIYCLGGNQSDKVSVATYNKSRILGYRRP